MKRRLNILCLLVMLVFCYSVFESAYYFSNAFMAGFRVGMNAEHDKEQLKRTHNMKSISLFPDDFVDLKDSVYNEKSGKFVPAIYAKEVIEMAKLICGLSLPLCCAILLAFSL